MYTNRDTVKALVKSIITRLENKKEIVVNPPERQAIQNEFYELVGPHIFTEHDLRERVVIELGLKSEVLDDTHFSETEQFKTAKAVIRRSFGDDVLNGLYYQKPLRSIAEMINAQLMKSKFVEEVFGEDDEMIKLIVDTIKNFNPKQLH